LNQLKTILQSKLFYIIIIILLIFYVILNVKIFKYESIYDINEKVFYGYITKITKNDYGYSLTIKNKENLIAYVKNNNFSLGDYVKLEGTLNVPSNNTIFNDFNYRKYLYYNQIFYTLNVSKIELLNKNNNLFYKVKNSLLNYLDRFKCSSYLKTFLFLDTSYLPNEIYESYQINGICHLLSIGSIYIHTFNLAFLKILRKFKLNEVVSYLAFFIIIYLFMILTNFAISILRSYIYLIISFLSKKLKINLENIKIFILVIFLTLIINPFFIYRKDFLYSYSMSFIIILNKNKLKNNYLINLVKISCISFIYSIPFNIYFNFSINLLSVFYNILYIPFSIIILPFTILTLIFPFFDDIFYIIISWFNNISYFLNNYKVLILVFKKMPIFILVAYLIIFIYIINGILNKKKYRLIFLVIILTIHYNINYFLKETYLITIDVKQGDSNLLYQNDKTILIDTGGLYGNKIIDNTITMMESFGIRKIDYLILTHGDYDHMGEAINLVNNFTVEKVIFNCGPYNDLESELIKVLDKKKIKYYSCIKELNIDNNKLYFLQTKEYDNENDNSNVIYTEIDNYKFLLMGDASITTEKEILNKYNLSDIDVLKIGHHGSKTSSSKEFINKVNPKYSIISVGKNNRYGHPNKEVLNNLEHSKIYRTDLDGSIMFKIKKDKFKIETCSP